MCVIIAFDLELNVNGMLGLMILDVTVGEWMAKGQGNMVLIL
jgi:hypothetical protein